MADKDLSEVPIAQRLRVAKTLSENKQQALNRNEIIAYASDGYSMKEIGLYFGLHYSMD